MRRRIAILYHVILLLLCSAWVRSQAVTRLEAFFSSGLETRVLGLEGSDGQIIEFRQGFVTTLRIANPNDQTATVHVEFRDPSGEVLEMGLVRQIRASVPLPFGDPVPNPLEVPSRGYVRIVTQIDLERGLEAGTVRLRSDLPIGVRPGVALAASLTGESQIFSAGTEINFANRFASRFLITAVSSPDLETGVSLAVPVDGDGEVAGTLRLFDEAGQEVDSSLVTVGSDRQVIRQVKELFEIGAPVDGTIAGEFEAPVLVTSISFAVSGTGVRIRPELVVALDDTDELPTARVSRDRYRQMLDSEASNPRLPPIGSKNAGLLMLPVPKENHELGVKKWHFRLPK